MGVPAKSWSSAGDWTSSKRPALFNPAPMNWTTSGEPANFEWLPELEFVDLRKVDDGHAQLFELFGVGGADSRDAAGKATREPQRGVVFGDQKKDPLADHWRQQRDLRPEEVDVDVRRRQHDVVDEAAAGLQPP